MSFDIDPQDKHRRILCHHPESDCIFEVNSLAEFEHLCKDEQVDDVTDIQHYEKLFELRQLEKENKI